MFKFKPTITGTDLDKINDLRDQPSLLERGLDEEGGGGAHLTMPHEAYTLGLSALQENDEPEPQPSGLRVIDAEGTDFKSIFDLSEAGGSEKEPQKHTDEEFLNNYKNALDKMFTPDMESKDYEVRSLKVPALHVDALWLHKSDEDVYIPVQSMGLFKDETFYQKADFFDTLKNAAKDYDRGNEETGG